MRSRDSLPSTPCAAPDTAPSPSPAGPGRRRTDAARAATGCARSGRWSRSRRARSPADRDAPESTDGGIRPAYGSRTLAPRSEPSPTSRPTPGSVGPTDRLPLGVETQLFEPELQDVGQAARPLAQAAGLEQRLLLDHVEVEMLGQEVDEGLVVDAALGQRRVGLGPTRALQVAQRPGRRSRSASEPARRRPGRPASSPPPRDTARAPARDG